MLNYTISNIGKIKKADIELDGITVIAGLNGTGKSTIAKCVFAASNSRKNILANIRNDKANDIHIVARRWLESDACSFDGKNTETTWGLSFEFVDYIMEEYESDQREEQEFSLTRCLHNFCDKNQIHSEEEYLDNLQEDIERIFKRSTEEYIEFFVGKYYQNVFKNQINQIGSRKKGVVKYQKRNEGSSISSEVEVIDNEVRFVGSSLVAQQENAIYIATHSVLDVCEEYSIRQNRPARIGTISSIPTRELIGYLFGERELSFAEQQQADKNRGIIEVIIEEVTHGHLKKNINGRMEFVDERKKQKIEFSNMSSGLKIFSVIQKLLENCALQTNDILIVDEPEVNLHPKWQVVLAEIMVRIYKELGIYIIVNSHSPYFIRAIQVKMAEYECARQGRFYFMEDQGNEAVCSDVTNNVDRIYDALYQPLNML
ncbi:MAG: AAA family ATPase [Lachnospiraceae bacterium]